MTAQIIPFRPRKVVRSAPQSGVEVMLGAFVERMETLRAERRQEDMRVLRRPTKEEAEQINDHFRKLNKRRPDGE